MCGGALSYINVVWWRQYLCCSWGKTNVFSISWSFCASALHTFQVLSEWRSQKNNGPIMNLAVKPHETVMFSECNGISCTLWGCSEVRIRLFCVFTDPLRWKWHSSPYRMCHEKPSPISIPGRNDKNTLQDSPYRGITHFQLSSYTPGATTSPLQLGKICEKIYNVFIFWRKAPSDSSKRKPKSSPC